MNFDKVLSIITWAAIAGLVILNADNFAKIVNAVGGTTTGYVTAVQGRPAA